MGVLSMKNHANINLDMTNLKSKANHRIALRLFHYIPLMVFLFCIWAIIQLDLVRLDDYMMDRFEILYEAFAEAYYVEVLAPILIHVICFSLYDWTHYRKLSLAFEDWIKSDHNIQNADDLLHATRVSQMPELRDQRWRRLLLTQFKRTLLLSVLSCLLLVPVVTILMLITADDRYTRSGFFGAMIIIGPFIVVGPTVITFIVFRLQAHWRLLLGGVSRFVMESESTFIGETFQNTGFLQWLDFYWADDWLHGYARRGIGISMINDKFPIFVYADQRSRKKMHILIASHIPDSCEITEELEEKRSDLKKSGYTIETTPSGLLVSLSASEVSSLLNGAERYGEEEGLVVAKKIEEVLMILRLMGGKPINAYQ
jgi:hypothetical protein